MNKTEQIQRNIKKSEAVSAIIETGNDIISEYDFTEEEKKEVWKRVAKEELGDPPKINFSPMTYEEARSFYHSHVMSFGKWRNTKLEDVDFDWLVWLDSQPDFRRDLTRFMASEFVRNNHYINSK